MKGYGPNFLTGGVASASSSYGGHPASYAFDDNTVTAWESGCMAETHWILYDLGDGNEKIARRLSINQGSYYPNEGPQTFTLQASNTGSFSGEEVILLTVSGDPSWQNFENREWTFENAAAYRYYRIYIINSPLARWTSISEIMLFEEMADDYSDDVLEGGNANASDTEGTYYPSLAVDDEELTFWRSQNTAWPHWWEYDFGAGNEVAATLLLLQAPSDYTYAGWEPTVFTLLASNIGAFAGEETTLLTITTHRSCKNENKYWGFENEVSYRYYRLRITASGYGTNEVRLAEVSLHITEAEAPIPTYLTEKDLAETQPVDLYEIKIDDVWYYYANSRVDVVYDGHTYIAWAVRRSEIARTADGKADKVTITLDNVSRGFTALQQYYRLTNCECRIRQIFRNILTPGNDRLMFAGYLASPTLGGKDFSVDVVQHIYTLQAKTPRRMYQRWCNSQFGDNACVTYAGTADDGTAYILLDSALDRPVNFFQGGQLIMLSGDNAGATRVILTSDTGVVTWIEALPVFIHAGDLYAVSWLPKYIIGLTVDTGTTVTINDAAQTEAEDYWKYGFLHITSGVNAGQKRLITASSPGHVDFALPLNQACSPGDTYNLYTGCDKTLETCEKFNNTPNYSGFTQIADVQNLRRYGK